MNIKITIFALVSALAASLVGCGSSPKNNSSESTAAKTTASQQGSADTSSHELISHTWLQQKDRQVINETPATYEAFGVDKTAKKAFEDGVAEKTKLPVISVTTGGGDVTSRELYTSCVVDVFNCDEGQVIDEASAGIKVRGNSSAYYGDVKEILKNQVPYRIKFDSKTSMLGLNGGAECKSWVLLKPDWDIIRNDIALRYGRLFLGDDAFCSDARYVDVYVNDEYKGLYLLCEQCQVNKNRVDITEPGENYSGNDIGWYLEIDNYAGSEDFDYFVEVDYGGYEVTDIEGETRAFEPAGYSVKNDVYTQEQLDFIEKYINNVFEIVYRACEKGEYYTFDENHELVKADFTTAEETVGAVMDIDSVVDMYLLYELVHDYDCGEGSFFMCVDFAEGAKIDKLQFTSPWDFNWAYYDSPSRYWAGAFCEESFAKDKGDRSNPWFIVLIKQDWFRDRAAAKWNGLYSSGEIEKIIGQEKEMLEEYREEFNRKDEWAVDCAYQLLDGWFKDRFAWFNYAFKQK